MKYTPSAITSQDLDTSQAPYLGGEFAVYLSRTAALDLGEVALTASNTGAWAANNGAAITAPGSDCQLVAKTELRSSTPCVVVFSVKNEASTTTTLTFTFSTPARLDDQSNNFPRGAAVDGVLGAGNTVSQILGLTSVVGGDRNVKFELFQLPEAATYVLVGCTTDKKFNTKSRKPVGIDCGMERDAYIKRGKSGAGELSIDSKFGGVYDRLTRFDGAKTTAMLVGIKDGQVTNDRIVFTQYVPGVEVSLPDGEGEAMENAASGKWKTQLFFVAP